MNNEPKNPALPVTSAGEGCAPAPKVDLVQALKAAGRLVVVTVGEHNGATVPTHGDCPDDPDTHDTR